MYFFFNINLYVKLYYNFYTIKKSKRVVEYFFKKYCILKYFFIFSEKKKNYLK